MARKIFKYILRILLIVSLLLILLSMLLYVPFIQNFIRGKAVAIVSEKTGMNLSVERIRLVFPLTLSVDKALMTTPKGDTLAGCGNLSVNVALWPLLRKEVVVRRLSLSEARAHFGDSLSGFELRAEVGRLTVGSVRADLKQSEADIASLGLDDGRVRLFVGESPPDTTVRDTTSSMAWKIGVGKLKLSGIDFTMGTAPQKTEIGVKLATGRIADCLVDLGRQQVDAGSVTLRRGEYAYRFDTTRVERPAAAVPEDSTGAPSAPWTIRVGHILLAENSLDYGTMQGAPGDGLDFDHIGLSGLNLSADSVYNRGADVRVRIGRLSFAERSGLTVETLKGFFAMDSSRLRLSDFLLETPSSSVRADIRAGAELLKMSEQAPLDVRLSAGIGMQDVRTLFPLDKKTEHILAGQSLTLESRIEGTLGNLSLTRFDISMPRHIRLKADGALRSVLHPDKLSGNLHLDGRFTQLGFLTALLPDTSLRERVRIPDLLTLTGNAQAVRGFYSSRLTLAADSGSLRVNGSFDPKAERYEAEVTADSLPLSSFLPADSLGLLTMSLKAGGQGFDPLGEKTTADAELHIARFDYRGFDYRDIGLDAALKEHRLTGRVSADNEALMLSLGIDGRLTPDSRQVRIHGRIDSCDLHGMGLVQSKLSAKLRLDIAASADTSKTYKLGLTADSIELRDSWKISTIRKTEVRALAAPSQVEATLRSGDMKLDFSAPVGIDSLSGALGRSAAMIAGQMREGSLDMEKVRSEMPPYRLTVTAGQDNVINNFLKARGIRFKSLMVNSSVSEGSPFSARATIDRLVTGSLRLDTLSTGFRQQGDRLNYFVRLANAPGNLDNVALIALYGHVAGNKAQINLRQRTRSGQEGFNFNLQAMLSDSTVTVNLFPEKPTLGFETWSVNAGNYIAYHLDKKLDADFSLTRPGQRISLKTIEKDSSGYGVELDLSGINIGGVLELLPSSPPFGGTLNTDLKLKLSAEETEVGGTLEVAGLSYDKQSVGDFGIELHYKPDSLGQHGNIRLSVNGQPALTAEALYHRSEKHPVHLTVDIPGLPLEPANAFLPADMARVSGSLKGRVEVSGPTDRLVANGELMLDGTSVRVPMIGTSFGFAPDKIAIENSIVRFSDYGIIAPNKQPLVINGTVSLADFSDITTDLAVAAGNFQIVNVPRNRTSMVYGKASMDLSATVKGPVDELTVRGNAELLGGTEINYVMRDSPLDVKNKTQDMVTFVAFADTTNFDEETAADTARTLQIGGMDLLVNIDVNQAAKLAVDLSEDGENRIDLQGGGSLTYTMNRLGDSRFTGKYVITGGQVRYNPPVISEKIFKISQGSFVEWIGDIADPTMNITAVETVRATVTTEEQNSRSVNFNIEIVIRNSLENLSITFDLAAPEDLAIQNQLSAMTPEQRATQAMSLLIYNTYSGPGTTAKVSSSNPLNDFIAKELNKWAQNSLKGVDLSFGIDSYDDAATGGKGSRTDYSYKLSKSLFNDRVTAVIGGKFSSDADPDENLKENLIDDISLEYRLTKRDNMFLKLFRHTGYESILEGEVTETGVGFIIRKKMLRFWDLFKLMKKTTRPPDAAQTPSGHEPQK